MQRFRLRLERSSIAAKQFAERLSASLARFFLKELSPSSFWRRITTVYDERTQTVENGSSLDANFPLRVPGHAVQDLLPFGALF
jgi:hypothetical protein